ncbi:MAG: PEP-CTERM sorting domain-containing protein [Chromatiaceae bacterium]|nr:PEP-CTERM sorting domain-containing protein [Gammaproteobacteria bacterium]MCP5317672.1 PEP-CTERM sorting domain-containing protein [Chromatiaceae bacterium]MCP5430828.1 PEP-CTERM sorting domain-containing protein [Chromatiaceae bacterium]MCP5434856.1 PEP-CTERM sorting domain-containing protein [Chromatiaceae bacterium]HOP17483.1 PEP-CTERM sorting domain-containing protein [Gammaproteobacteria bacterium]
MKRTLFGMLLILATTTTASAGIIINVADNGGFAEFTFTGSDTLSTSGNMFNGFWVAADRVPNLMNGSYNTDGSVTSGAASFSFGATSYSVVDVWEGFATGVGNYAFGWRTSGATPGSQSAGTAVSISGSILTDVLFAHFNQGVFFSQYIGPHSDAPDAMLRDGITINVGEGQVPVPTPLALLGLGLAAIGWTKRKV